MQEASSKFPRWPERNAGELLPTLLGADGEREDGFKANLRAQTPTAQAHPSKKHSGKAQRACFRTGAVNVASHLSIASMTTSPTAATAVPAVSANVIPRT